MKIVNAKITNVSLEIEDHDIMTFWIYLEWNGGGQGLGGYCLDRYDRVKKCRFGWGPGLTAIRHIMEVAGVKKWEDLKGKLIRAKIDSLGSSRPPIIGHIMDEKWFDLKEFMENAKP